MYLSNWEKCLVSSHLLVAIPMKKVNSQLSSLCYQSLTPFGYSDWSQPEHGTDTHSTNLLDRSWMGLQASTKQLMLQIWGTAASSLHDKQLEMAWEPQYFPEASV